MINIGIGISWAKAIYSVANNVIANFKARVLADNGVFEAGPCLDATLEGLNAIGLLDNASLIITPNAYNTGILYDVIPNTTLGDMDVVRATTATRVNSAGLIELVPYNLLQYSEQFDNAAWTKARGSVTANATIAPNGTTTADKFVPDTQVNPHFVSQNASNLSVGGVYTSSVYAKISEWNSVAIFRNDSAVGVSFRLDTQVATVIVGSPISYSITSVGNGWFRLDVCFTTASASDGLQIRVGNNSSYSLAGNNSDGLFLWGAQLVAGTLPKDYLRTETRLNIPRIDYTNASCPSILVEPQRTNVQIYSEDFSNAVYIKVGSTVTTNAIIAPDGNTTADKLVEDTSTGYHTADILQPPVSAGVNTVSVFVKAAERTKFQIEGFYALTGNVTFDLTAGTATTTAPALNGKIENYGNGWFRCSATFTDLTGVNAQILFNILNNAGSNNYTGNGTSGLYLWGAQLELGAYATSYIPTAASTVTRNADVISKTGISSLIGTTYTVYGEIINEGIHNARHLALKLPTGGNYADVVFIVQYFNGLQATANNSSSTAQFTINSGSYSIGQTLKYALRCEQNNVAFYINGVQIGVDTLCTIPAVSTLYLGTYVDLQLGSKIKSTIIFPSALTNTELAQLTTL